MAAPMAAGQIKGELTSPVIPVTGGSTVPLSFYYWREVEHYTKGSYDKTYVQVRYGSGPWQTVWSLDSKTPSEKTWKKAEKSLSVPAGVSSTQVRFVFDSVDGKYNNYRGWFIDDVCVGGGGPPPPDKVATPTFAPAAGTYSPSVDVSLSCTTSGATIRYTLDGSTPTESSPTYSTPIHITSTTTIKARGYKRGWTPSDVASGTYTIEEKVATPTVCSSTRELQHSSERDLVVHHIGSYDPLHDRW